MKRAEIDSGKDDVSNVFTSVFSVCCVCSVDPNMVASSLWLRVCYLC